MHPPPQEAWPLLPLTLIFFFPFLGTCHFLSHHTLHLLILFIVCFLFPQLKCLLIKNRVFCLFHWFILNIFQMIYLEYLEECLIYSKCSVEMIERITHRHEHFLDIQMTRLDNLSKIPPSSKNSLIKTYSCFFTKFPEPLTKSVLSALCITQLYHSTFL